jgi:hypothetical protein
MFILLCFDGCFNRVNGVDVCLAMWSWQIKSVVKLAVNIDLTVKFYDLFDMAIGCHNIGLLIEEKVSKYKDLERIDCNFLLWEIF